MAGRKRSGGKLNPKRIGILALVTVALVISTYVLSNQNHPVQSKPVILYVNQGNGYVAESAFGTLIEVAKAHGFTTIFFQVYREGMTLFDKGELKALVNQTHEADIRIFFSFYLTNDSQVLPESLFGLGEDGVNLDLPSPPLSPQAELSFVSKLRATYTGEIAVTTNDLNTSLKPDFLVLETYYPWQKSYLRPGIIGSVGAFATSSSDDYQTQVQAALRSSDGVMVFDYYWLVKNGY